MGSKFWETLLKSRTFLVLVGICILVIIIFFVVPRGDKTGKADIVNAFSDIAQLAVEEFEVTRIFFVKECFLGCRWLVQEMNGTLKFWMDASQISGKWNQAKDKIIISLPKEVSFDINFPPANIKTLFEDRTGLRKKFTTKRILDEQKINIEEFKKSDDIEAIKAEVIKRLKTRLKSLLKGFADKEITIEFSEQGS